MHCALYVLPLACRDYQKRRQRLVVWVAHCGSMRAQEARITLCRSMYQGARRPPCPSLQDRLRPHRQAVPHTKRPRSLPHAALAISQWNGERDPELVADAAGDVPVSGQIFSHQHVARGEPSLAPVSRLKFRHA
jgi:hypothetical protein